MNNNNRKPLHADDAIDVWNASVAAVDARAMTRDAIRIGDNKLMIAGDAFDLQRLKKIIVIGFGKCSGAMAAGVEDALKELQKIEVMGIVNVPEGQTFATRQIEISVCRSRGSNFPTETVVRQTERILKMIDGSDDKTLVIALVSGGGSALLEAPLVPLVDLINVSKLISDSGASIERLNTVRRALSGVKAGGLARVLLTRSKARMVGLIVSDVIGDSLDMVASGPTVVSTDGQEQRIKAAIEVLAELRWKGVPASVFQFLRDEGMSEPRLLQTERVKNFVLANNVIAVQAAVFRAKTLGHEVYEGETVDVNRNVVAVADDWVQIAIRRRQAADFRPLAIVAGGEPTVKLCQSPGRGGRNLQMAALVLQNLGRAWPLKNGPIAFVSGGTDGEDGNVAVAGASIDAQTLEAIAGDPKLRIGLEQAIEQNDCCSFFELLGRQLMPPPVSTNVCDIHVMLIGQSGRES